MPLGRTHPLADGPTAGMEPGDDFLDDLDDFLQWVKDPRDGDKRILVSKFDQKLTGGVSALGAPKSAERRAEFVDENLGDPEIALLRNRAIAENSFGSRSPQAKAPVTTILFPPHPHLRSGNTFVALLSAHDSPRSNSSSGAASPLSDEEARTHGASAQAVPIKKKRDQNRSRKRQREELLQLRVIAKELESELHTLLNLYGSSDRTEASSPSGSDELASSSSSVSLASQRQNLLQQALFWKRAALNEKQQTDFAWMENARLRALIDENVLVCDSAREVWHKHPATNIMVRAAGAAQAYHSKITDFAPFESLRVGLDELFERQSVVFDECGFRDNAILEQPSQCFTRSDGDSVYVEMLRSSVLPFSPEKVNQYLWSTVRRGLITPNLGELKYTLPLLPPQLRKSVGSMIFLTLTDSIPLPEVHDVAVNVWIVIEQLTKGDRILAVWKSLVEVQSASVPGFQLQETGWHAMQCLPVAGKSGGLEQAPSVLRLCVRSTPERDGIPLSREELADGSIAAKVIAQYHRSRYSLIQVVENKLLEESLRRTGAVDQLNLFKITNGVSGNAVRIFDPNGLHPVESQHVTEADYPNSCCSISNFAKVVVSVESELSADKRELLMVHEDESHSATSPAKSPATAANEEEAVAEVPERKVNPRRNRKRRKHEVDALRVQMRELSEKLERLQAQAKEAEAVSSAERSALMATHVALPHEQDSRESATGAGGGTRDGGQWIVITSSRKRVPSTWEALAWTQRERARAAVSENLRLRSAYESQLQTLRQLEVLYLAHQQQEPRLWGGAPLSVPWRQDLLTRAAQLSKRARTDPFDADTAIFASLGRDFSAQYAKAEAILASAGLGDVEGNFKRIMVPKRGENGIYFLENLHSRLYARDVFESGLRSWTRMSNLDLHMQNEECEQIWEQTQDTLFRKIVNTIRLENAEATLIRRTALKRYVESHRVVIVWDTALEIAGAVTMRLRERGWKVLRRPRALPPNYDGGPIALEQTCSRITPEQWTTYNVDDIAPGSLAHMVVGSYSRHLRQMHANAMDLLASDFEEMAVRTKYFSKKTCDRGDSDGGGGGGCAHRQQYMKKEHWRHGECHRPASQPDGAARGAVA
ncbi:hypothetical protein PybrP1_005920 [[Pythium] brassicae (nom. inval.)]|nr:hypothetical protein PybrP1_005920 [[Pythium] brassicae (nom. inval.)]